MDKEHQWILVHIPSFLFEGIWTFIFNVYLLFFLYILKEKESLPKEKREGRDIKSYDLDIDLKKKSK